MFVVDLIIILNIYLKYYLYLDYVVEILNVEYICVNEVMDGREKYVFGICKKIIESGISKDGGFEVDVYVIYIVDLVCVIVENIKERFLFIVLNEGVVENFDRIVMVEILCIVGSNGYERIC